MTPLPLGAKWADREKGSGVMARIEGTESDDYLQGTAASDEIFGLAGDDFLEGSGGRDSLYGGDGDDRLAGGTGNDWFDGGAGSDMVTYNETSLAIRIDLQLGLVSFPGTSLLDEHLGSIENAGGGAGDDTIFGTESSGNILAGGAGDDSLSGRSNDDTGSTAESVLTRLTVARDPMRSSDTTTANSQLRQRSATPSVHLTPSSTIGRVTTSSRRSTGWRS
jgi:Ca2+-binding RTX toxin-like protein